jgi:predicted dehydrogenase
MVTATKTEKLKIGFLGVGWIGKNRMEALSNSEWASVSAISDVNPDLSMQVAKEFNAKAVASFEELLAQSPDGVVIATPSALHASQAIKALEKGIPVFCQKPLGRNYNETKAVVDAAIKSNKLLGLDLSYRHTTFKKLYNLIQADGLGKIYAVDLTFHNAYGPNKAWFYNPELSGGGCVIDLGVHLVDLALWTLGFPEISRMNSTLFHKGKMISGTPTVAEDYATAQMETNHGTSIRLTCSWNLPAGCDAIIEAKFYGEKGGASFKNVKGSFYDFTVEQYNKTNTAVLSLPPDEWSGRAISEWAEQLYASNKFNPEAKRYSHVAKVLDMIYKREMLD